MHRIAVGQWERGRSRSEEQDAAGRGTSPVCFVSVHWPEPASASGRYHPACEYGEGSVFQKMYQMRMEGEVPLEAAAVADLPLAVVST